jgi:cytoskeletal protein CcmA (bactofilin family)
MLRATMYVHIACATRGRCVDRASPVRSGYVAAPDSLGWMRRHNAASAVGGQEMVFRKDRGGDSFQRQISALRQQLGGAEFDEVEEEVIVDTPGGVEAAYVSARGYEAPAQYERDPYGYQQPVTEIVQTAPSNEPAAPAIPVVDGQTTVISPNAAWKGEIVAEGSMHILGKFEGDIRVRDDLFILDDANVDATIAAGTVTVSGRYNGTLNCNTRLEVLPTGRVRGEIYAPALVVHNGAIVNGKIRMTQSANAEQPIPAAVHRRSHRGTA